MTALTTTLTADIQAGEPSQGVRCYHAQLKGTGALRALAKDTDSELVRRVQKGDKRAFDLLFGRYQHKILSLVRRYVSDEKEAEDVTQEAFIKAYRALPRFRGDSQFFTWVYRIAINTAKNHLVSRARRPPSSDVDPEEADFYDGSEPLRELESPERALSTSQLAAEINAAISDLPDDLRSAVTLREFDGMSYEQIAQIMECPVGTVRSRIFRAREAIELRMRPFLEASIDDSAKESQT